MAPRATRAADLSCVLSREGIVTQHPLHHGNVDRNGDALYFSRQPIPHNAQLETAPNHVYKQVCVISFRYEFLMRYAALPQTPLEQAESIDMLRALEHGYRVRMVPTEFVTQAVDVPDDVAVVERMLCDDPFSAQYA